MVNDFARFNCLLTTLDELYESLYSAMRLSPTAYFANIDYVTKEDFKAFSAGELMLDHCDMFNVQAQIRCLNALKCFHRPSHDITGRLAGKYPGILLLENHEDVIDTIIAINSTKTAIKHCVQDRKPDGSHGRNHLQKHEFLHQHRGAEIISYQLYRHIDVINCRPDTDTVLKSVNFYWAYKNADQRLLPDRAKKYLYNRNTGLNDEQLKTLSRRIDDTQHSHRFYVRKSRNASVNLSLYYGAHEGKPVVNTVNAAQPIILFDYDDVPTIRPLSAHVPNKRRENRKGHPWVCLNKAANLFTRPITDADRARENTSPDKV
jgi:hypothetical protein